MPNNAQAKKRLRQDAERRDQTRKVKSRMRTAMKRVLQAENTTDAAEALPIAMKRVDKAAKRNAIHANTAARYLIALASLEWKREEIDEQAQRPTTATVTKLRMALLGNLWSTLDRRIALEMGSLP